MRMVTEALHRLEDKLDKVLERGKWGNNLTSEQLEAIDNRLQIRRLALNDPRNPDLP